MRTKFYWDGDVVRIRLEDNGARLTTWVYDSQNPFTPVAKLTGIGKSSDLQSIHQNVYSITSNHLGTPTSMIDETGKIIWEETFDLWGKPHDRLETRVVGGAILTNVKPREANKNQAISQPFRFPGQYEDEETGLYYNRYRYYMPGEGMYTQRDPIGLAGGNPTVYGYVFNTLKHIDPWGLLTYNTMPSIPGFQWHHTIPQKLKNHLAFLASGINIHSIDNLISLPTDRKFDPIRAIHKGSHPNYNKMVEMELDLITAKFNIKANSKLTPAIQKAIRADVEKLIGNLESDLAKNNIKCK